MIAPPLRNTTRMDRVAGTDHNQVQAWKDGIYFGHGVSLDGRTAFRYRVVYPNYSQSDRSAAPLSSFKLKDKILTS